MNRLAGQATLAAQPAPPTGVQVGDIGADGRLVGVDAVLDQIGDALSRQVTPLISDTVLPIISRDTALQKTVGTAAGTALAKQLEPWIIVGVGALLVIAWVRVSKR